MSEQLFHIVEPPVSVATSLFTPCSMDEIASTIGQTFGELWTLATQAGVEVTGPAFCRYHNWTESGGTLECGMPIAAPKNVAPPCQITTIGGGKAVLYALRGPYEGIKDAYSGIRLWATQNEVELLDGPYDSYVTDPSKELDSSKWITEIYWPVG